MCMNFGVGGGRGIVPGMRPMYYVNLGIYVLALRPPRMAARNGAVGADVSVIVVDFTPHWARI